MTTSSNVKSANSEPQKTTTSRTETGHAKNVANYEQLIAEVTALGTAYNPSKSNLKLPALNAQVAAARTAVTAVNAAEPAYKLAVSARDAAFASLAKLLTRVNNAFKASDTTQQVDDNVATLIRKLQGRRATPKKTEEQKIAAAEKGKTIVEVSSSQMGFDNRLDNLDKLIRLLSAVPTYAPNEPELKVTALTALYNELKTKNTAVILTEKPLNNARITRNEVLYKPIVGMVDTSVDVKTYIKSVYGPTSPQYKAISGLTFVNR